MSGGSLDSFGSPPDPQTFGRDRRWTRRGGRSTFLWAARPCRSPYDIDLTRNAPHAVDQAAVDNPFGVAELERILRGYDRDAATLPQRLAQSDQHRQRSFLLAAAGGNHDRKLGRAAAPGGAAAGPAAVACPASTRCIPVDILYAQVPMKTAARVHEPTARRSRPSRAALPWELMEGLKMDINRPFGAGRLLDGQQWAA